MALTESISQWANTFADKRDGIAFEKVCQDIYDTLDAVDVVLAAATATLETATFDRFKAASLADAGLMVKSGAKTIVQTGASAWYGMADGVLLTKAASTDMDALVGSVTAAAFNVYVFTVDSAGALTTTMGTEGAALADVVFPTVTADHCVIGFVVINPLGTGSFVGGTTELDDATVVPTAAYVNTWGGMSFAQP